jgi:dTDP-4-dehydrorhamnose reductase
MVNELDTPILLISPDGMLGRAWAELLRREGLPFTGVSFPAFDLRNPQSIAEHVRDEFRTVINCSAYTDVDGAEAHEADAAAINADGVARVAERCKKSGALLVHYSTDYVFDGEASSPYRCDEPRRPQNAYGRTKARGEELIVSSGATHLILRTSWLYAPWGKNFVDTIARLCREKPSMRIVHDQRGRPTSAQYLAARSLDLLRKNASGIYHVTDGGECSWFEFAQAIAQAVSGTAKLEPCTADEFARPAKRPAYSVLDLSTTEALIGPSRDWRENLHDVLRAR